MEQPPADNLHRSHSTATSKSRQRSQSTTSVNSGVAQKQWYDGTHAHSIQDMSRQMTPEAMVMHSASQLQNPRGYGIDPALGGVSDHMGYGQHMQYKPDSSHHQIAYEGYIGNYGEGESQIMEGRSDEQDDIESVGGSVAAGKKAVKSSAANEKEMRELFRANQYRSLPEVAAELHGNERGPNSERQRQVFAMLWINHECDKGKGSVPRGRVYGSYVNTCASERVTVLNPASFGKLVRVLHPGLKTRRLGQRGESKYHYVGFSLKHDNPNVPEPQVNQATQSFAQQADFSQNISLMPQTQFPADRAVFPPRETPAEPQKTKQHQESLSGAHSLYTLPHLWDPNQLDSAKKKIPLPLKFMPLHEPDHTGNDPLALPSIEAFLPPGTDADSAKALMALYRSHCTSILECLRYCKEKTFFHLHTSFHGTLTMPVQKLFAKPEIAPWIEECDFVLYQKMIAIMTPLALQVVPRGVLEFMRKMSQELVPHIKSAFQNHPKHIMDAKVAPATLFAGLVDRVLRVNLCAHAAANLLSDQDMRDAMYSDWIKMVRTRKLAECVPTRAMDDVVDILLSELRNLFDPVNVSWDLEGSTLYGAMALRNGNPQSDPSLTTMDRFVAFLSTIPERFPYATAAEVVCFTERLGTVAMRDMTIGSAPSFGNWWVTKSWVDEMIQFMAERGGFMSCKTHRTTKDDGLSQSGMSRRASEHESRYSSASEEFLRETSNGDGSGTLTRPMDITSQAAMNSAAGLDDSGISMRTPEDEFTMAKYQYAQDHANAQMRSNGLGNGMSHPSVT